MASFPHRRQADARMKPGAEKLTTLFGLSPRFEAIERTTDWTTGPGGEPFFYFQYRLPTVARRHLADEGVGSMQLVGEKYRYPI